MKTDDITTAARLSAALLRSALDADWDTKAKDLDWSCRRTLDHIIDTMLRRVFPWAPDAAECSNRWDVVRWCCGRAALPTRARLNEKWWWHAAPIVEWDGTRKQRTAPPAWT